MSSCIPSFVSLFLMVSIRNWEYFSKKLALLEKYFNSTSRHSVFILLTAASLMSKHDYLLISPWQCELVFITVFCSCCLNWFNFLQLVRGYFWEKCTSDLFHAFFQSGAQRTIYCSVSAKPQDWLLISEKKEVKTNPSYSLFTLFTAIWQKTNKYLLLCHETRERFHSSGCGIPLLIL